MAWRRRNQKRRWFCLPDSAIQSRKEYLHQQPMRFQKRFALECCWNSNGRKTDKRKRYKSLYNGFKFQKGFKISNPFFRHLVHCAKTKREKSKHVLMSKKIVATLELICFGGREPHGPYGDPQNNYTCIMLLNLFTQNIINHYLNVYIGNKCR